MVADTFTAGGADWIAGGPDPWEWRFRVTAGQGFDLGFSLFDDDRTWGGSAVLSPGRQADLLTYWRDIRATLPRVWLHDDITRVFGPGDWAAAYMA